MTRIRLPQPEEMTAEQREVYDAAVAGKRGSAPLPMLAWLHSPEFAARAQHLGEFARYDTALGPLLSELAILVVARHWTAQYEWSAHKRAALSAGLDPEAIASIAAGREPSLSESRQALVYRFSTELLQRRTVSESLYAAAVSSLGEQCVVELVGVLGYYTLIAMTLNTFDITDGPEELQPLPLSRS